VQFNAFLRCGEKRKLITAIMNNFGGHFRNKNKKLPVLLYLIIANGAVSLTTK
jgi:hypothetical protein